MLESNDMRGQLRIEVRDASGQLVETQVCRNRIVKSGRQLVAHLFGGNVPAGTDLNKVGFIAVGQGTDAATDAQQTLVSERLRKAIGTLQHSDFVDKDASNNDVQRVKVSITTTFDYKEANGDKPLVEAGLFTASTAGTMYNRVVFDPVKKSESFQLTLLWEIIF